MKNRVIAKNTKLWREFTADAQILTERQLSEKYGICMPTVVRYRKELGISGRVSPHGSPFSYYTVYKKDTDELICSGAAVECAKILGLKVNSLYGYVSRSSKYDVFVEEYRDVMREHDD